MPNIIDATNGKLYFQNGDKLFVSNIRQTSIIEVNESGTIAAAASSVSVTNKSRPTENFRYI